MPLGLLGAALGGFAFVALTDLDGDKVKGWDELFKYGTNPFAFNHMLKYARDKGISNDNLVKALLPLEANGIDANEKFFVDYLIPLDKQLQQKLVEGFLADYRLSEDEVKKLNLLQTNTCNLDGQVQAKVIDSLLAYKALDETELKKLKIALGYISSLDQQLQQKVAFGFLEDGSISAEEAYQIKFLQQLPKEEQAKLIEAGSFTDTDIDKDSMSNYFEKVIADMPWNVFNGRYALLLNTTDTGFGSTGSIYEFLINDLKYLPENVVYLSPLSTKEATWSNFINTLLEWQHKVTKNDIVYVDINGHGNVGIFAFADEIKTYEEIDKYLDKLNPMKMLVVVGACGQETALEPLKDGPSPRIVTTFHGIYFTQTSKNFVRMHHAPEPEAFDLDGNGYASLAELIEVQNKVFKEKHYI